MTPEDQYPSTFDCAPIAGAQDDLVLACMENAWTRLDEGWTGNSYISDGPKYTYVCAVGAVLAADGLISTDIPTGQGIGASLLAALDEALSREAKEAIELLNEAALELHPEATHFGEWSGPLEWVNQEWHPEGYDEDAGDHDEGEVKAEVLRIYDHAIAKRSGTLIS